MSFDLEYSEKSKNASFCPDCGAEILRESFFCFECGPPDLPKNEPEEVGISLEQAVVRIIAMMFLFICVALVKFDAFNDDLVSIKGKDRQVQSSIDGKKVQDDGFELIHTVIPSSANVRSKPSNDGQVIAIVEEGMNLTIIEKKDGWTKINVFEKKGWIASRLIKSEVQKVK